MPLTDVGRNQIAGSVINDVTVQPYSNANAHIGVGDNDAAFQSWHVDLVGSNKFYRGMDVGYPQRSDNVLTFRATFGVDDANFAWSEWGIFNASEFGVMLNRVVESLGTKPNNQSWQLTVTLTINNTV